MAKNSSKPKSDYAIQTVTNALRMLEVFHDETEVGVSELARRLRLHKNNAFRLLATLELAGYIQQTPATELYHLGPRCLELGHAFARSHGLMNQARPLLEALARDVKETAHLGVLSGRHVVHLDGELPDQRVLTGLRVGERVDAHCTALGKCLLASRFFAFDSERRASGEPFVPGEKTGSRRSAAEGHTGLFGESESGSDRIAGELPADAAESLSAGLEALFEVEGALPRHTPATVDDPTKLMDELRAIRMRGYATDLEEFSEGLHCVAAPVRDGSGRVVAALSLSGPSARLGEERLHGSLADAIGEAAGKLSSDLGCPVAFGPPRLGESTFSQ